MTMWRARYESPIGPIVLLADGEVLTGLYVDAGPGTPAQTGEHDDARPLRRAAAQLDEYFAGERKEFDLPIAPRGTPFQQRVWRALLEIPYGGTTTYAALAASIAQPTAARAVGSANGRNPISIVIPCHRVLPSGGGVGGYAWGVERKQALLELEAGVLARRSARTPVA